MSTWGWERTVKISTYDRDIVIRSDSAFGRKVYIGSPEELQALIERLEELAEELGWNDDQG